MIEDARGRIDYDESGDGPTVVLVPGSCSTGAAWRPVIAAWNGALPHRDHQPARATAARPSGAARAIPRSTHEADIVEAVVRKAGGPVHLVGHSFGAVASLALALRDRTEIASLTLDRGAGAELLRDAAASRSTTRPSGA